MTDASAKLSAQEREDLKAINGAMGRMRDFTPADPYILTIPQDEKLQYRHSYAFQARQWLEHTPFHSKEDPTIQYQTFVFHEPGKEIYMLHNSQPSEGEVKGKERTNAGPSTPNVGPKKKISLNAYKKKQAGQTPEVSSEKEAEHSVRKPAAKGPIKGPVERVKADEEVLAGVESEDNEIAPPVEEKKDLKRKREVSPHKEAVVEKKHEDLVSQKEEDQRAVKKAQRTQPPETEAKPTEAQIERPPQSTKPVTPPEKPTSPRKVEDDARLPPKLSPPPSAPNDVALPPKLSPVTLSSSLPVQLSPTIPDNINATLKARVHYRSASRSSDISAKKDATIRNLTPPRHKNEVALTKKSPKNGFRANSSSPAVRSDAEERGRPVKSVPRSVKTPEVETESSEEIAVAKSKKPAPEKAPSLIVKLKFKKSQRESVRRILRMRPNPAKAAVSPSKAANEAQVLPRSVETVRRDRRDTNAKGVAKKIGPASTTNGVAKKIETASTGNGVAKKEQESKPTAVKKRPLSDDSDRSEEPPAKRTKPPPDALEVRKDQPSTPDKPDVHSPAAMQKATPSQPTPSTMRKDVLSAAMKREHSADSNNTPSVMSQASPPEINGSQQANGVTKPPTSNSQSTKTSRQQAWEAEQKRLETLGRELKHAATAHLKSSSSHTSSEKRLAAVKSLESLLAYMLAFTCADEAALAAEPKLNPSTKTWRSMQAFFGFVKRNCDPFPELLGVACWLGVVFNARVLDLVTQNPADGLSREAILETQAMMQRAALDAESKLDIDVMQSVFPRTWKARTKAAPEVEALEPGKGFVGGYKLPLGVQTSPLRAARAGHVMLGEWMKAQEALEYGLKLKL
ncbi:hypothetical protein LTR37_004273 [Vermiconidia calcicola]|uniref:Uncharacterized protein n=1 Tax=Vermiconidia calcicola TaxID=1690605 RepID=A0ACC3NPK7_9PEZI|nr:hypothetical protein LTR37_004273 [Vermiconidia calcicola]